MLITKTFCTIACLVLVWNHVASGIVQCFEEFVVDGKGNPVNPIKYETKCAFFPESDLDVDSPKRFDLGFEKGVENQIVYFFVAAKDGYEKDPTKATPSFNIVPINLNKVLESKKKETSGISTYKCSYAYKAQKNFKDNPTENTDKQPLFKPHLQGLGGTKNLKELKLNIKFFLCEMDEEAMISDTDAAKNCPKSSLSTSAFAALPGDKFFKIAFLGISSCIGSDDKPVHGPRAIQFSPYGKRLAVSFCKTSMTSYSIPFHATWSTSGSPFIDTTTTFDKATPQASKLSNLTPVSAPRGSFYLSCDDYNLSDQTFIILLDKEELITKYGNAPIFDSKDAKKLTPTQSFNDFAVKQKKTNDAEFWATLKEMEAAKNSKGRLARMNRVRI